MNAIDLMIDDLIAREGDFVDHPADKGGPTR
jgi:lysozyme family protein